jgi:hypothetical protein
MFNTPKTRIVAATTLLIALTAITASASWYDYLNPLYYFSTTQTEPAAPEPSQGTTAPTPDGPMGVASCQTGGPVEVFGTVLGTTPTAYATLKAGFDAINAGNS